MRVTFLRWPATLTLNAGAGKLERLDANAEAGLSSVLTTSRDAPAARRAKASSPPRFSLNRGFATAELHHMGLDEDASSFCHEAHSFRSRHPTGEEAFRARPRHADSITGWLHFAGRTAIASISINAPSRASF